MSRISLFLNEMRDYSSKIEEETGKNQLVSALDMCFCAILYGSSPANYYKFDFYNVNHSVRKSYVTNRTSSKLISKL